MAADSQPKWPREARTAGNAGVMLVGRSAQHGGAPAAVLGGRFYTGKRVYAYTDFGGGVEHSRGETPQQGAFREFAEELLGQDEARAKATAAHLCVATSGALVGGRPFVHKNYVMFIVSAEAIVEAVQLPPGTEGSSAIDQLFAQAVQNSELTSVALVSIEELLLGASSDGMVCPLSVRQLDGKERSSDAIQLRALMVGQHGSIFTISHTLECFADQPVALKTGKKANCSENGRTVKKTAAEREESRNEGAELPPPEVPAGQKPRRRKGRWNRENQEEEECAMVPPPEVPLPEPQSTQDASADDALQSAAAAARAQTAAPAALETERQERTSYVFDMETGDPDDVLTLLFLGSHPAVELRAVTITPGSEEQVALVRWLLQRIGQAHVRLGAQAWPANAKKPVSLTSGFYRSFGRLPHGEPRCERADQVLLECCDESVTLVTGAPLHNLADALQLNGFRLGRWVAQGGFAGEGVVPPDKQMDKFKGMETCSTWNFGGNIPAAHAALTSGAIGRKTCVSKNVCHSACYDDEWHAALGAAVEAEACSAPQSRRAVALGMMHSAMDEYLRRRPGGKKLHDPLALAVALDESVCELVEVELFCRRGQWGSRPRPGSGVRISVAYDASKFRAALLC